MASTISGPQDNNRFCSPTDKGRYSDTL